VERLGLVLGKETLAARLLDSFDVYWHLFVSLTVDSVTKLRPKLILEGTRLTGKTDLALALNENPLSNRGGISIP
jgi:hypothetical protein